MKSKKMLIVDDQLGIRLLLSEVFTGEGYEVFQAANGRTAIEITQTEKPDIIILDMKIPGMDGIEILKNIRGFDSEIKVVMMTAYGELDILNEAYRHGILSHFTKPFDIGELKRAIKEIFIKDSGTENIIYEKVVEI
ncbi:MAG: response regulator [Vulcanibacillus sp.]